MNLSELFANPVIVRVLLRALVTGILVSLCAAVLGVSLVSKRYSMIGDGLSHVGFGALAVATVLDLTDFSLEITLPIVIAAAYLLLRMSKRGKMSGDAAIAVVSTGAVAIGSLIYNFTGSRAADICGSLFGSSSIITLTDKDLIFSIVLSDIVLLLFILFYNRIFAITFDETFARATGIRAELYNMMLAGMCAVTIVLGMKLMGSLMISALVIFPSLTAMRLCRSFKSTVLCAGLLSTVCFVIGLFLASILSFQTGPVVVTIHLIVFTAVSLICKKTEVSA